MCFTIFQNEKRPSQAIKTASSKSGKIEIFTKGLTHGFGPKFAISQSFFFQALSDRKMCFTIFQNEKTPFQAIKKASSKSGKIAIFSKGLTHGFGQKIGHFSTFFLGNIGQETLFYDILERENTSLGYKNKKFKKSKNSDFCKGVDPWFWPKIGHFSIFFLGNIGQENVFYDILERKNAFLGYKNSEFKKWKNCDFFNGANPWFWSKIGHFPPFFLGNIGQEKVFYDILEHTKKSVLGYKNSKFIKWKNCDFCKGVNSWFWSNIRHFSMFCFQAIQARKKCFTIFQN